eukprot:TRINITY_DN7726_c0_g1_i1.p1 TRINITY_DN7726_c0_g1~~TRINITY_DN7726_c0_g1_i1.p1  ORF type:complete len:786 (+),score=246.07 TRINITY_DN7726_c0_g1_i1:60-2360(+)
MLSSVREALAEGGQQVAEKLREGADTALAALEKTIAGLRKQLNRQKATTVAAVDMMSRMREQLSRRRTLGLWMQWFWKRKARVVTETLTFDYVERAVPPQMCDVGPTVTKYTLGCIPIFISPGRLLSHGGTLSKVEVTQAEARDLGDCAFPTHDAEAPPTRLPALAAQYLVWRRSVLTVAIFLYAVVLFLRIVQMAQDTGSSEIWEAGEPVVVDLPNNYTYRFQLPSADDVLQDDTEKRVRNTKWVLEGIDFASQVLLVAWLGLALHYWKWFRWSRRAVLYGWCAANLLRFLVFYVPWLSYVPPEMFASDGCSWLLDHFVQLFRIRYDQNVAQLFNTTVPQICDRDESVGDIAERTVAYGVEFAAAAVVSECRRAAGKLSDLCPSVPTDVDQCRSTANLLATQGCPTLRADQAINATVELAGQAVHLTATAMEVVPYLALLLKALSLLVLPSLGLVMGVAKGALNVKKLVPERRLPGLLVVLFTACVVPWCALCSVCLVAAIGNVLSALAALFITASQMVFCPFPAKIMAGQTEAECEQELGKRGKVRIGLMLVAVVMLLVAVQTAPHLGPEIFGGVATAAMSSKLVMVTIFFGVAAGYFFSQLVFTDLVLNMMNEVYVRPVGDKQFDPTGQLRHDSEAVLIELSCLFPRTIPEQPGPDAATSPSNLREGIDAVVSVVVHVHGRLLKLLFGSGYSKFDYQQQIGNLLQSKKGSRDQDAVPPLVTLVPSGPAAATSPRFNKPPKDSPKGAAGAAGSPSIPKPQQTWT